MQWLKKECEGGWPRHNEEQGAKLGQKDQNRAFLGYGFYENTSSKSKFRSKGADLFQAPLILKLNCAYEDETWHSQNSN